MNPLSRKLTFFLITFLFASVFYSCKLNLSKENVDGSWESVDTTIATIKIRFNRDTMQMIHDFAKGNSPEAAALALQIEKRNPMSFFNYKIKGDTILYSYQRLPAYLQPKDGVRFYFTVYYLSSDSMVLSDHGHLIPFRRED